MGPSDWWWRVRFEELIGSPATASSTAVPAPGPDRRWWCFHELAGLSLPTGAWAGGWPTPDSPPICPAFYGRRDRPAWSGDRQACLPAAGVQPARPGQIEPGGRWVRALCMRPMAGPVAAGVGVIGCV